VQGIVTEPQRRSFDTKSHFFEAARSVGLFRLGRLFQQNSGRLFILCYHGISKSDEHLWRPTLYMPRSLFRQRLQLVHDLGYQVLSLSAALERLYAGALDRPTVVFTFDDGWHDFYTEAWPELRSFGYPATVYQTTYYSLHQEPVFDTACSYLLWKGRGGKLKDSAITGSEKTFNLDSPASIGTAFRAIEHRLHSFGATSEDKYRMLAKVAAHVNVDLGQMLNSRFLHLMTMSEVAEISRNGIDIQLHTHRHRLPVKKELFLKEIGENQDLIAAATGKRAVHFCYPNGLYRLELPAWLREAEVLSATTCEPGFISKHSEPMLLPRIVDSYTVSQARFESWLSGIGLVYPTCKRRALSLAGRHVDATGSPNAWSVRQPENEAISREAVTRAARRETEVF
jgi:peptidoglycan/xylan/chitin deacetylase (PgdA/CDA1 family)